MHLPARGVGRFDQGDVKRGGRWLVGALQLGVEGTALVGLRLDGSETSSAFSLFASLRYTFPSAR